MLAALSLGACSDDKDKEPEMPDGPGPVEEVSYGAFIVNSGSMYSNIDGSLQYIEYSTGSVFDDVFKAANGGMTVGDTFNAGYVFDDEIYLAVTDSRVLHIIDRDNFKLEKTISTAEFNAGPRQITSYGGKIYMTLYGQPGYVAEVDPETEDITRTVEVGPLPEYIVACGDKLYVAVSDAYGNGEEACVAIIDPQTMKVTARVTGIVNPVNVATDGNRVFVCSWGQYMNEPPYTQYNYGIFEVKGTEFSEKLADATYMWIHDTSLYYYSFPYGEKVKYGVYNTATSTNSQWIDTADGVDYPNGAASDPESGDVFMLSYNLGEGGFGSFTTPGYVKRYKADGTPVTTYATGVGPTAVFFNVAE